MNQSQIKTQKLEWIQHRETEAAQQWRHDLIVDLAFAVLWLCIVGAIVLVALGAS